MTPLPPPCMNPGTVAPPNPVLRLARLGFFHFHRIWCALKRKGSDRIVQPKRGCRELLEVQPLLNRTIWMYWDKGWDTAPALCKLALDSWRMRNPTWDVRFLDRDRALSLTNLPEAIVAKNLRPAHLADMIRLELLAQYGGVWADMTTFCEVPLDEWLQQAMPFGFFAFAVSEQGTCANWFLAATPGNPILMAWRNMVYTYWSCADRPTTYLMFYDLFALAMTCDRRAGRMWRFTSKLERLQENILRHVAFDPSALDGFSSCISRRSIPMHKFSFNVTIPDTFTDTPFSLVTGESTRAGLEAKAALMRPPVEWC